MAAYKQSTAYTRMFKMILSSDHVSLASGKSPTVNLSKAGAAFGAAGGTVTEVANGWYKVALNTTDTNTLGDLAFYITATSCDDTDFVDQIVAYDPTDAVRLGLSSLANAAAGASGGLLISGSNTGPMSISGGVTFSNSGGDALALTSSGSNGNALNASGNGTGAGILSTGGGTGNGMKLVGGGTSGDALLTSATSGHGATFAGTGTTKHGINATGGATTSHGISATGGGVGHGILATSGSGSTGDGIRATAASTNGNGLNLVGVGTGAGALSTAGLTGPGAKFVGGATSGDGVDITTTAGDGLSILPTAGNGITVTANGTSKHGIVATGGTAGTSDGFKCVAGTGGVDIRGNITGNLVGTVSTLTTYTGNTPQTGDSYAIVNSGTFGNAQLVRSTTPANTLSVDVNHKVAATVAATDVTGNVAADLQTIKTQTVTCAAGVTVNGNVGTTQPVNFTGTGASALVKTDVIDWNSVGVGGMPNSGNVTVAGFVAGAITTAAFTAGAINATVAPNLDVAISSRMATFSLPANFAALAITAAGRMDVGNWLGSPPNALQSGRTDAYIGAAAAGVINATVAPNLDAAVSSRMATFSLPTNFASLAIDGSGRLLVQPTGLDAVLVAGKTLPHALQIIGGMCGGKVSGAETGTEVFADFAGVTVATVSVDGSGNRTNVVYAV